VDILREEFPIIHNVIVSGSFSHHWFDWPRDRVMTDRSVIAYPAILHFSESRHYIREVSPVNTMADDTLPHDWSYQAICKNMASHNSPGRILLGNVLDSLWSSYPEMIWCCAECSERDSHFCRGRPLLQGGGIEKPWWPHLLVSRQ
jgi:hypothetical protein